MYVIEYILIIKRYYPQLWLKRIWAAIISFFVNLISGFTNFSAHVSALWYDCGIASMIKASLEEYTPELSLH